MEDFGTLAIRLHFTLPREGKYMRSKSPVIHRYYGTKSDCMANYATWRRDNERLCSEVSAVWEVRQTVHTDDLPYVSADEGVVG